MIQLGESNNFFPAIIFKLVDIKLHFSSILFKILKRMLTWPHFFINSEPVYNSYAEVKTLFNKIGL